MHEKLRAPAWMWLSALTILFWGAWGLESKLIVDRISPWMNQVLFSLGLLPVMLWMLFSRRVHSGTNLRRGAWYALVTGLLGGAGNIAFYLALARGGKVSVVVPLTCLFPLVTVIAAYLVLKEKLTRAQLAGLVLAMIAIYLLSV
ncbi:MAG TPA: DMT family transporter [Bryobacteraceae bacterium]|nr:DMT family transporter [Bryobacteraceae bacterium]